MGWKEGLDGINNESRFGEGGHRLGPGASGPREPSPWEASLSMLGESFLLPAGPTETGSVTQSGSSPLYRGRRDSRDSVLPSRFRSAQLGPLCSATGLLQGPDSGWRRLRLHSVPQAALAPLGCGL